MSGIDGARAHIAVVGAGVAGLSTAHALARRGAAVTLVDAGEPGTATEAGAGIIQPWGRASEDDFSRLYALGADRYPGFLDRLAEDGAPDIGYRATGGLITADDPRALDGVAERLREARREHPLVGDVDRLGEREAAAAFPPLAPGLHAVRVSGGARVDGRALGRALRVAAARRGMRTLHGRALLLPGAGGARLRVGDDELGADAVVVAAGAWTNGVLAPLGLRVGVEPQRGQLVHLRLPGADTGRWPSVGPHGAGHYLLAFDDSRVVAGATREAECGFDARLTAAGVRGVLDAALAVAPGLADAGLLEARVGLRPLSTDGRPHVGEAVPGVFVNAGFGPGGLTMGPAVGDLLASAILDGAPAELAPFLPRTAPL